MLALTSETERRSLSPLHCRHVVGLKTRMRGTCWLEPASPNNYRRCTTIVLSDKRACGASGPGFRNRWNAETEIEEVPSRDENTQ